MKRRGWGDVGWHEVIFNVHTHLCSFKVLSVFSLRPLCSDLSLRVIGRNVSEVSACCRGQSLAEIHRSVGPVRKAATATVQGSPHELALFKRNPTTELKHNSR